MTTDVRRGLSPVRHRLGNGATVIAKPSPVTPAVALSVSVRAGSVADPPGFEGASHFLARVIDRGTQSRSGDELAELLDSRGVSLTVSAMRHAFVVSCTCLSEDFSTILALMADVVRNPSLPEADIATRRGEIVTEIRQDQDNPAMVAVEEQMARLYPGGHPYGRRVKGTLETVGRIDRHLLRGVHDTRFMPADLVVVAVGDVDPARVVEETGQVFGDWRGDPVPPIVVPSPPPVVSRCQAVYPMMNKSQADIAYGFNTIARRDPAYYACSLMNNALGQYAMGGRLGDNIRERQGMAYYVFSAFEPNVGEGPLVIRAGVNPANVDRTIAAIDDEVRRMAGQGLTAAELAASKQYLIGSMPRMLETNAGIAAFLLSCEQFGLGMDHDTRLPALLDAVTLDEANAVARRFLMPDRATVTIAGPYAQPGA
jgi:zinc protease